MADDAKDELHRYLREGREALLWKLDGVGERDARRPLTPTGTNLLGLVKHLAGVEAGYFGEVFARPFPEPLPWTEDDAEPNADMWASAEESRAGVVDLYRRVQEHSDATIAALPLDAPGTVPWWRPESRSVTLRRVLVHVVAETHRHAGHADVVRELVDGAAGLRPSGSNLPDGDAAWWAAHRARLQRVADEAGEGT
ncbi:DinB family protein [Kineococcus sp. SYSU DK004]|uniref:DinB family protein n=1 Tax=Kineococcus sp. SYSU DK004 TaxID=3383125 RepID=UPI003D7D1790